MFTMAIEGRTYKISPVLVSLTLVADQHRGLQGKTPTNFKNEVSCRCCQKFEEIHGGELTGRYASNFLLTQSQREKQNGHDAGHPRCEWGDVSLKNVFLARLVRVSVASWQPEIFVERPSV